MMVDKVLRELPQQLRYIVDRVWFYVNEDARCFIIASQAPEGLTPVRFCLNETRDYNELYKKILLFLENNIMTWTHQRYDVLFQVAPLVKNERVKEQIQLCRWLAVNLDYRVYVPRQLTSPGCQGGHDYALTCSYQQGGQWVYIERPPLGRVLEEAKLKMKARPAIVVDSGTGYHLYFQLDAELSYDELKLAMAYVTSLFEKRTLPFANRLMRLPGTINHEVGRLSKVIWESDDTVDFVWLLSAATRANTRTREKKSQRGIDTWMR